MGWPNDPRPAHAIIHLRDRVKTLRPDLPASGFGMIGDANHQHEGDDSDHNPWKKDSKGRGVVRAIDLPLAVGDGNRHLAERLRKLAKGGHPAFGKYGYIISDRRIASHRTGWRWIKYTGTDPHTGHVHVSVGRAEHAYDSELPWTRIRKRDVK